MIFNARNVSAKPLMSTPLLDAISSGPLPSQSRSIAP
jgi:hypothetical protein